MTEYAHQIRPLIQFLNRFNADIQIPEACRVFINEYSTIIFKKNIRYNFILHLNCLYDFGLLDANQMKTVIDQLNDVQKTYS